MWWCCHHRCTTNPLPPRRPFRPSKKPRRSKAHATRSNKKHWVKWWNTFVKAAACRDSAQSNRTADTTVKISTPSVKPRPEASPVHVSEGPVPLVKRHWLVSCTLHATKKLTHVVWHMFWAIGVEVVLGTHLGKRSAQIIRRWALRQSGPSLKRGMVNDWFSARWQFVCEKRSRKKEQRAQPVAPARGQARCAHELLSHKTHAYRVGRSGRGVLLRDARGVRHDRGAVRDRAVGHRETVWQVRYPLARAIHRSQRKTAVPSPSLRLSPSSPYQTRRIGFALVPRPGPAWLWRAYG